jgi:hypothetical protein
VRRAADVVSILCLASLVAVYVAAKIDFFRSFDPHDVSGYLAGHWPFWAVALTLAAVSQVAARFSVASRARR